MTTTREDDTDRRGRNGSPPESAHLAAGSDDAHTPEEGFNRTVDEGQRRLDRNLPSLLATGLVGGIDVGTGVLAMLLVEQQTGSKLLGGLAFAIGFVALTLARSELFTEDFLIPITTVIARRCRWRSVLRLWIGTLAANLVGGWAVTGLVMLGFPSLRPKAVELGTFYAHLGIGTRSAALGVLGGLAITLMTWMQHTTDATGARVFAAVTTGWLLGAASLNHAIVCSLLMFAALHTGHAPFGYLDYAGTAAWAALWNLIGGVGLVTVLRLLQVPGEVKSQRARARA